MCPIINAKAGNINCKITIIVELKIYYIIELVAHTCSHNIISVEWKLELADKGK